MPSILSELLPSFLIIYCFRFSECQNNTELIPCVAVIDEDDDDFRNNEDDWARFRRQYPHRFFCLLIPYEKKNSQVVIPPAAKNDSNFHAQNVTRDEGIGPPDDWFNICLRGRNISANVGFIALFIDNSTSMYVSTVKNSYDKFVRDAKSSGFSVCGVNNTDENWIRPFWETLVSGGECNEAQIQQRGAGKMI